MDEKPKFRLGDDGELEPYEGEAYPPRKQKYIQRTGRNPALVGLVLFQSACVGGMCLLMLMMLTGIVSVDTLKCRLFAECKDDLPTPFTESYRPTIYVLTSTVVPTPTPTTKLSEAKPCDNPFLSRPDSRVSFISDTKYPFGAAYLLDIQSLKACLLLTNHEGVYSLTWSPNGSQVAFTSSHGLWLANALGQEQHFIYADVWTDEPVDWSPDNTKIAFTSKAEQLTILDLKTNKATAIIGSPANAHTPRWSSDSNQLLFSAGRDADSEIYMIEANGQNLHRLTDNKVRDVSPVWMQGGESIVYVSEQDGNPELYSMVLGTGTATRYTGYETRDVFPDVSLQSGRIVYVSYVNGNNELFMLPGDGRGNRHQLTFSNSNDTMPMWRR